MVGLKFSANIEGVGLLLSYVNQISRVFSSNGSIRQKVCYLLRIILIFISLFCLIQKTKITLIKTLVIMFL